jgi:hypothetical protein
MKLFRTLILWPLLRDPLRTALTALAVALGIAVVVAIDLAGDAATANGGIDERWIGRLAALPIEARFAPVVETQIEIEHVGSLPLYGLDFVAGRSPRARASTSNCAAIMDISAYSRSSPRVNVPAWTEASSPPRRSSAAMRAPASWICCIVNLREELPVYYAKLGYSETGASPIPAELETKLRCHFIEMMKALA